MSDPIQIKSCETCAHFRASNNGFSFNKCARFQTYTSLAMNFHCTARLVSWVPVPVTPPHPPRRSLRRWFNDTFLAL